MHVHGAGLSGQSECAALVLGYLDIKGELFGRSVTVIRKNGNVGAKLIVPFHIHLGVKADTIDLPVPVVLNIVIAVGKENAALFSSNAVLIQAGRVGTVGYVDIEGHSDHIRGEAVQTVGIHGV